MKKLLLPLALSLLSISSSLAIGIQSTGTNSASWSANGSIIETAPLSLQSNPGNIFASITFDLNLYADDQELQDLRPSSAILIPEGSNISVSISTTFLRIDSVVDASLEYSDLADVSASGSWINDATDGTDNYLGVQFLDINDQAHYGWMQFEFRLFSNGGTAIQFLAGDVTDTPGQAATTGQGTVPEPSTVVLLAVAAAGIVLLRRHRAGSKTAI